MGTSCHCYHFPGCHPERSEGSLSLPASKCKTKAEILRFAQNDNDLKAGGRIKMYPLLSDHHHRLALANLTDDV